VNYMKNNQFSVLIPVYFKENPLFLSQALESVFNQTLLADEVILLEDGGLSQELDEIISKFEKNYNSLKVIKFAENRGLGYVLNDGLKYCKHEYVFRMDSD